jgi:hypothetical protein
MKKHLLIIGLLLLPVALFAQGRVQFANSSSTVVTTNSGAVPPPGQLPNQVGSASTALGLWSYGLYIAPQGTVDVNAFSLVGPITTNSPTFAGRFNGGNPFVIPGNSSVTIAFQVRAWQTSAGATYEVADGNFVYRGVSGIGQVTPTEGGAPIPALFGTNPGQVGGFVLAPNVIPEPSSIALGLLGLGAIALFRRRK